MRRVHQIVATLAVLVLTLVVIAFRMSRPERFFTEVSTDDSPQVLQGDRAAVDERLPEHGPGRADDARRRAAALAAHRASWRRSLFAAVRRSWRARWYFTAFVRARESMAPMAIGAASTTRLFDRLIARAASAAAGHARRRKCARSARDVAQWSQLFLMAALVFIYLYNIRMLPLGGDARATLVAYANLGMAGFVIAAICLRFAYPSVSAEGKAFWLVQTAPISYREFLRVKVLVYAAPLTLLSLLLTAFANVMLDANAVVWTFTLIGASLLRGDAGEPRRRSGRAHAELQRRESAAGRPVAGRLRVHGPVDGLRRRR